MDLLLFFVLFICVYSCPRLWVEGKHSQPLLDVTPTVISSHILLFTSDDHHPTPVAFLFRERIHTDDQIKADVPSGALKLTILIPVFICM